MVKELKQEKDDQPEMEKGLETRKTTRKATAKAVKSKGKSKGNKKEVTPDEKLEQALVPESEWPYEVPGNWVWVRLGSVVNVGKEKVDVNKLSEPMPYIGLEHIAKNGDIIEISDSTTVKSTKNKFYNGDILYGKLRPYLNKHDISNFSGICSTDILVLKSTILTSNKLIDSFLNTDLFIEHVISNSKGINLPRVNEKTVLESIFPLPPLQEQHRIVNRIESLFGKLDQAKELVQEALDTFEDRKAAILHKAFTGELTKKWREENGVGIESWKKVTIKDVTTNLNQGWSPKCESYPSRDENKWGVIKTTAIQHLDFIEIENKELPLTLEPKVQHELQSGDILITRAGPRIRVGVCCLVRNVRPKLLLCDKAYRIEVDKKMIAPEFFVLQLNTPDLLNIINKMKTGISDSGVNLTQGGFLKIPLMLPTLNEQITIVKAVNRILEKESDSVELSNTIDQIDQLKKTILAKAFRGELGTNDPCEENALKPLSEVLVK